MNIKSVSQPPILMFGYPFLLSWRPLSSWGSLWPQYRHQPTKEGRGRESTSLRHFCTTESSVCVKSYWGLRRRIIEILKLFYCWILNRLGVEGVHVLHKNILVLLYCIHFGDPITNHVSSVTCLHRERRRELRVNIWGSVYDSRRDSDILCRFTL